MQWSMPIVTNRTFLLLKVKQFNGSEVDQFHFILFRHIGVINNIRFLDDS